jgi:hypothetical protein
MLKYVDSNDPIKIFLWHDICFIQFFLLPSQRTGTHLVYIISLEQLVLLHVGLILKIVRGY